MEVENHTIVQTDNEDYTGSDVKRPIDSQKIEDKAGNVEEPKLGGLDWEGSVGVLPGTNIKFRVNDEGDVEMLSDHEAEINNRTPADVSDDVTDGKSDLDESADKGNAAQESDDSRKGGILNLIKKENAEKMDFMEKEDNDYEMKEAKPKPFSTSFLPHNPLVKCSFCGISNRDKFFSGRFCSKHCVARNAARHRKKISPGQQWTPYLDEPKKKQKSSKSNLKFKIIFPHKHGSKKRRPSIVKHEAYTPAKHYTKRQGPASASRPKVRFNWDEYLIKTNATAALPEVFYEIHQREPISAEPNLFKLGHLLEAIDPLHESMFCVMSVSSIKGHRIRLHFEGFSEAYDYWVNKDSPFIFPCGFCESTNRTLTPPGGYKAGEFTVNYHAKTYNLTVAPPEAFTSPVAPEEVKFKIGDHLEAVDHRHTELTCIATVNDVLGSYVLVHFDGWDSTFDYWALATSNYLKPTGWCAGNGVVLAPPPGGNRETGKVDSVGVPDADLSAFSNNGHMFEVGMKLEAVDKRNHSLVRVATVTDTDEYRIQIHFDGWSDMYDYWVNYDNLDIHPHGWCDKTGHPIEPPICLENDANSDPSGCPIPGCSGVGHIKHDKYQNHYSEYGCPYSPQNLQREALPDRLLSNKPNARFSLNLTPKSDGENKAPVKVHQKRGRPRIKSESYEKVKRRKSSHASFEDWESNKADAFSNKSYSDEYSVLRNSASVLSMQLRNADDVYGIRQRAKLLPIAADKFENAVRTWSIDEVANFVVDLTGNKECLDKFTDNEIDGEAFLLLTQYDLTSVLSLKLGPSVKIYNAILLIKVPERKRVNF